MKKWRMMLAPAIAAGTMAVTAATAFAQDASAGPAEAVSSGLSIFTATIGTLTSNPFLLAILGCGLIPLGFKVFRAAKSAAGGSK